MYVTAGHAYITQSVPMDTNSYKGCQNIINIQCIPFQTVTQINHILAHFTHLTGTITGTIDPSIEYFTFSQKVKRKK